MLTSFVDHGFDVQSMVEAPRWVNEDGRVVTIETRYAAETLDGLRRLGHELTPCGAWHDVMGGAQAIRLNQETGALEGAADPRREGYAIGF
jgi:gamma-glutamyltranspeptidase/glutathione hydrolase